MRGSEIKSDREVTLINESASPSKSVTLVNESMDSLMFYNKDGIIRIASEESKTLLFKGLEFTHSTKLRLVKVKVKSLVSHGDRLLVHNNMRLSVRVFDGPNPTIVFRNVTCFDSAKLINKSNRNITLVRFAGKNEDISIKYKILPSNSFFIVEHLIGIYSNTGVEMFLNENSKLETHICLEGESISVLISDSLITISDNV